MSHRTTGPRSHGRQSAKAYQPTTIDQLPPGHRRERGLFDNPNCFAFVLWLANISLAALVTYLGACTSTIEKRFQLKSSQTAFFFTVTDIVGLFTVLFVIYYGQKRNRARVLGALYLLCAFGSFLCSVPHYLYSLPAALDPTTPNNVTGEHIDEQICVTNQEAGENGEECEGKEENESGALISQAWWIILGQTFTSFSSAVFPLIVACIDDKVDKRNSSMYIAILCTTFLIGATLGYMVAFMSLRSLASCHSVPTDGDHASVKPAILFTSFPIGATLGYMIAFMCLRLPVSFPGVSAEDYPIGPDDPRWIGAWWLGFVISSIGVLLLSAPLFFFSDHRNPLKQKKIENLKEIDRNQLSDTLSFQMPDMSEEDGIVGFAKGLSKSVLRVITNCTVMCMIMATCANTASLAGGRAFGPKYIQNQFELDASRSALLTGIVVIPAAFIGTLSGGYIIRVFNLQNKGKSLMILLLHMCCFVTTMGYLFIGCPNPPTAGITTGYHTVAHGSSPTYDFDGLSVSYEEAFSDELTNECNTDCQCEIDYQPVCGYDGITYVTPCHAGCRSTETWETADGNRTVFVECSCIPTDLTNEHYDLDDGYAFAEACPTGCDDMWIYYICVNMVFFTLITLAANPTLMLQIRMVEERDRSVMMGISNVFMKVFGFIPGPIFFGATIEKACVLFQTSCGKTGNCILYDLVKLRYFFYGLVASLRAADLVFVVMVFLSVWVFRKDKPPQKNKEYQGMELHEKSPISSNGSPSATMQTFTTT